MFHSFQGVIDVGCTREVRIGGLLVRLTGVAETGWRNKNSDLSYESRHNFMDELIDLRFKKTFKVYPYLNLDAPYMRDSTAATEEELIVGCCGRQRGTIVASMKVQEVGLLPGETTRITLTVEDRTRRKRWQRKEGYRKHFYVLLKFYLLFRSTQKSLN
ncbi:hypothetical protein COOONC_19951 [Cooperia oncophora]